MAIINLEELKDKSPGYLAILVAITLAGFFGKSLSEQQNVLAYILLFVIVVCVVIGMILTLGGKAGKKPDSTKDPRFVPREPSKREGSLETGIEESDFGYTFKKHYNEEADPSISYIRAYKNDNKFTLFHRHKNPENPIDSRYYVIKGQVEFYTYNKKQGDKRHFRLNEGDSLMIPDSWWFRFNILNNSNELEMIVICRPRWEKRYCEKWQGGIESLPE